MLSEANEYAPAEADAQLLASNVSDDELERAANEQRQAITWQYCTQWWVCPA
jgi:hypothetical protein